MATSNKNIVIPPDIMKKHRIPDSEKITLKKTNEGAYRVCGNKNGKIQEYGLYIPLDTEKPKP